MLTPASVHSGDADKILASRAQTKSVAFERYRERFVKGRPKAQKLAKAVWINQPRATDSQFSSNNQEVEVLKAKKSQE